MRVQSLTEIKPPADCRNAQLKMSAKQTRIPQQERRGVLETEKCGYNIVSTERDGNVEVARLALERKIQND